MNFTFICCSQFHRLLFASDVKRLDKNAFTLKVYECQYIAGVVKGEMIL